MFFQDAELANMHNAGKKTWITPSLASNMLKMEQTPICTKQCRSRQRV